MPMTKAERQRMADMEEQIRLLKALRWTEEVSPDVPAPLLPAEDERGFKKTTGFLFSVYGGEVKPACSSWANHGYGTIKKQDLRGPKDLYSTRLLALRGLRYHVELECAEKLARIDAMIETEQKGGGHGD